MTMETATLSNKAGHWAKKERTARNLSLRELAREIRRKHRDTRITHTTLSDAERGEASPETWKLLAEYFNTPVNTVLTWAGFLEGLPTKDELVDQIENDLNQMSPAGRQLAAKLIRSLLDDHKKD